MKKVVYFLIFCPLFAIGQIKNSVFPQLPYTELNAIAVEGNHIYTAGDCNTALVSTDAGQSWTTISIEENVRNIRVVPGSGGTRAIYQMREEILEFDITTMEFKEVSNSSLFLSSGLFNTIETDQDHLYVISNQSVHKASFETYEWEKVTDFELNDDAATVSDITANYLYVGTLEGLLLRVDLGTGSKETMNEFMNRIFTLDMVDDDLGYLSIQNFTYPIKTTDGGMTYTDLEKLPENIRVTGYGDNVIMTINTNRLYVSLDAGATSEYIPIPNDGTFDLIQAIFLSEEGILYLAGRSSMVVKTEDFGSTFENLNEYKRENLQDIVMNGNGAGIALGGFSSLVKTADGGENWELLDLDFSSEDNYLNSAAVTTTGRLVIAGSENLVIVENDEIVETVSTELEILHYNKDGDYLIGIQNNFSDHVIVKSTDHGLTWESKAFIPSHRYHISQSPEGKIFIPGSEDQIYISNDHGETWEIENFGDLTNVLRVDFIDDTRGMISTGNSLYLTTDGGNSTDIIASGFNIRNLHFISQDQMVYTTSTNSQTNIYESTDGGESFAKKKEFCSASNHSYRDDNNIIWLAQNGGHINKYAVEPITSTHDFAQFQSIIFPNPASVGQRVTVPWNKKIEQLSLLSPCGNQLITIQLDGVNSFDLDSINAGIYIVRFTDISGQIGTAKLVIIH